MSLNLSPALTVRGLHFPHHIITALLLRHSKPFYFSHNHLFTLKLISEIIYLIRQGLDELFEIANHLSANGYVDTRKAFLVGCVIKP
jgi:hypothetical protein